VGDSKGRGRGRWLTWRTLELVSSRELKAKGLAHKLSILGDKVAFHGL
jgi:hypothetical protein